MRYFQIMSGDAGRDFALVMFDFGVVIVGGGHRGNLEDHLEWYKKSDEWKKVSWLLSAREGDRVVLHNNRSVIQAIGEIYAVDGKIYHYSNVFSDVDGWDLQHYCFVKWKRMEVSLGKNLLYRGTASRLYHRPVINQIESEWSNFKFESPSFKLPSMLPEKLTDEAISTALIYKGLRIEDAEETVRILSHIRKLGNWYVSKGSKIPSSEHEIRAFIVIPLFKALGWSYQKMAVEFSNTDLLLFDDAERKSARILVETKSLWTGSSLSRRQAENYLNHPKKKDLLATVKWVLLTDGIVYWLYDREKLNWPHAYMSLKTNLLKNPAFPRCEGALTLIKNLIP